MKRDRLQFSARRFYLMISLVLLLSMVTFASLAPAQDTIVVGCSLPFQVPEGIEAKKVFELVVDDFNKSGGLILKGKKYDIKLIIYDDKYTPEGGRAAVERLVNSDKVNILINMMGSGPTLAGLAITEPLKMMVWCTSANNNVLIDKKYTYRIRGYMLLEVPALSYLKSIYPNIKTVVTIGRDDMTGHAMAKSSTESAELVGLKVIENIYHLFNERDFNTLATKVKSINPDLIVHSGNHPGTQYGLILKALYQSGFKGVQFGPLAPKMDECLPAAGSAEAMEGLYSEFPDTSLLPNPTSEVLKIKNLYQTKYGKWDESGMAWVSPWYVWLAAVRKANSMDPEDVQKAVSGMVVDTLHGTYRIIKRPDLGVDRYCDAVYNWNIAQVRKGKGVFVKTVPSSVVLEYAQKKYGKKFE